MTGRCDRTFYDALWKQSAPVENLLEQARREKIVSAICKMKHESPDILDLGCGRGLLPAHLAELGKVTGVDWSEEGIQSCRNLCPQGSFVRGNFFDVSIPQQGFDIVVSQEVIEHLLSEDQGRYLGLVQQSLRHRGHLLLTTPNGPVMDDFNRENLRVFGKPWSAQPVENWLNRKELARLVCDAGFRIKKLTTFIYMYRHTGYLRLVNSWKLRQIPVVGALVPRLCRTGLHIFLVAQKA